jgi:hypothetical protein
MLSDELGQVWVQSALSSLIESFFGYRKMVLRE